MKLSVLPVSYFKQILSKEMSLSDWAREGVALGLDAIDISVIFLENRSASYLKDFRKAVEQEGISIAAASTYPDFTNPSRLEREKQLEQFKKDLEDLARVGTRIVRVTAGQAHPGLKEADGIGWALDNILASVDTAGANGIQLVFENHAKPGVWQYPDFDFPTHIFLEMARRFRDTPVKIQFDCANPIAYGDEPVPILEKVVDRVHCIHASDTGRKGELKPVVIGTGLVPYKEIFQVLKKAGYDGWINIEEASGCGKDGVRKAVEFIRESWSKR